MLVCLCAYTQYTCTHLFVASMCVCVCVHMYPCECWTNVLCAYGTDHIIRSIEFVHVLETQIYKSAAIRLIFTIHPSDNHLEYMNVGSQCLLYASTGTRIPVCVCVCVYIKCAVFIFTLSRYASLLCPCIFCILECNAMLDKLIFAILVESANTPIPPNTCTHTHTRRLCTSM